MSDLEKLAAMRMRMLRLGEGWSALTLAQEYKKSAGDELDRTMIAKIESDKRQIKAGEVEGVARVFGLTSADLLNPDGPTVFLSYAEQDGIAGQDVATWLADHGFLVASAGPPAADTAGPGAAQRHAFDIDIAQAFVALLSPSFLSSPRCGEELGLAVRRNQRLVSADSDAGFIYVLRIADTSGLDDSGLQPYSPIDLLPKTGDRAREVALSKVGSSIILGVRATTPGANPRAHTQARPAVLDRDEELENVLYNLASPAGSHFWLVTSPPGLGKSRFLDQLTARIGQSSSVSWITSKVNLRYEVADRQHDARNVIRKLFDIEPSQSSRPDDGDGDVLSVAQKIIRKRQPWLCLLDSAELLPESAVTQLRDHLGKIYREIQDALGADARLAFVVASRRDDGWKGIWPPPQPSVLALGGFNASVVQNALEGLAADMPPRRHSPADLREDAELVQEVTEGVPELVEQSLRWIRAEEWLGLGRLKDSKFFDVSPYIREQLLAPDSLFPEEAWPERPAGQLEALLDVLRALVPYRFFTLSHVYNHQDHDESFTRTLKNASWSIDDLWHAIAGIALLRRPLDEPWQEIHPVVRRLLFRHFYPRPDERADAHAAARDFITKEWAAKLLGKERIIGMVESIWHEAARLRLSNVVGMGAGLAGFVSGLPFYEKTSAYTETELRNYAAQRMMNDDELQREVADARLFEELIKIVLTPGAQGALR